MKEKLTENGRTEEMLKDLEAFCLLVQDVAFSIRHNFLNGTFIKFMEDVFCLELFVEDIIKNIKEEEREVLRKKVRKAMKIAVEEQTNE